MEVVSLGENYSQPIALCLGFFDCMHLGHISLLDIARKKARGAKLALFTFCNSHFETLKRPSKLIYTFDERLRVYESLGVDVVLYTRFDEKFMAQSGAQFLKTVSNYNLRLVVCGADFTCGSDLLPASSLADFVTRAPVEVAEILTQNGSKISSTLVRNLLEENKIEQANACLSEPFFCVGKVTHGRHVGSALGFPTANIDIPAEKLVPCGVFGGVVTLDCGQTYKAIVNVGNTPTFGLARKSVEAHLLGFDGDLYGREIKVALTKYLRPITRFSSAETLKHQLQLDAEVVKND